VLQRAEQAPPEIREQRGGRVRHRPSPNRRGVVVPFRVFSVHGVARTLGSSLPVRPQRSPNARPFRYSFHDPGPRTRLLGRSSLGVRPSYTVCPAVSAGDLSIDGTSPGVSCPFNAQGGESPRPAGAGTARLPGRLLTDPIPSASVSLAGFRNLSATSSSLRRPTIFRRVAFLGFLPTGVRSSHEAPTTRRRRHPFLAFLPRAARVPS
jgi:hypothetical protein